MKKIKEEKNISLDENLIEMEGGEMVEDYFNSIIENIDTILESSFYEEKEPLLEVKDIINSWYEDYKKNNTLKNINVEDLKKLDLEITDYFAKYVETEPIKENYCERLSYDFGELEELWKAEMLKGGGKKENE